MKSIIENLSPVIANTKYLPISHTLRKYNSADWICFGLLTHRYPTAVPTQVDHFRRLMDTLGGVNHCFAKRLHWFCRVEGDVDGDKNTHIHFLLGGHKVTNGHFHRFDIPEVCGFLGANWPHGIHHITPYISGLPGVEYVTKVRQVKEREDYYELSKALHTHFLQEVAA